MSQRIRRPFFFQSELKWSSKTLKHNLIFLPSLWLLWVVSLSTVQSVNQIPMQSALKSRTAGDSEWWVPEPWGCRVSAGRYRLGHLLCRLSGTWSQVLSLHRPHQVMFSAFCKFVSEEIGSSNLCLKGVCTLPPCWIHPHPLNTSRCQCKTWICPSWMWTITPFYCYFIIWDFPVYLLIFKCF